MQCTLIAAYNVVLKSAAVLVKSSTEDPAVRGAVKKAYRVFSNESSEYIKAHDGTLAGVEWDDVVAALDGPEDAEDARALREALSLLSDLYVAGAAPAVTKPIVCALAEGDAAPVDSLMLDAVLAQRVKTSAKALDDGTREALRQAGLGRGCASSGIMDIAKDISGSMDIEALMRGGGGGGPDAMTALLGQVTADITGRMERGDIDREKLISEATGMLGMMQSGGLAQMMQTLMGAQLGGAMEAPVSAPAAAPVAAPAAAAKSSSKSSKSAKSAKKRKA